MKFLGNLYTLLEIGINNNFSEKELKLLSSLMNKKETEKIEKNFPILQKFIPFCNFYEVSNRNVLAMSAYVYDLYQTTGLLPSSENYDIDSSRDKLEYWQYIIPYVFEINPNTGFEFANDFYDSNEIWNIFLAGNARMNFYTGQNIKLEERVKYAIVEYMLKRPDFFNTDDFVKDESMFKKYNKNYKKEE